MVIESFKPIPGKTLDESIRIFFRNKKKKLYNDMPHEVRDEFDLTQARYSKRTEATVRNFSKLKDKFGEIAGPGEFTKTGEITKPDGIAGPGEITKPDGIAEPGEITKPDGITERGEIAKPGQIETMFLTGNTMHFRGGYNYSIDFLNMISLSAAIWILDYLTLEKKLDSIYQYLPLQELQKNMAADLLITSSSHPMYDPTIVSALVYLIRHRNTAKVLPHKELGSLVWDPGTPDQDETSQKLRKAYEAVIALIDPEVLSEVSKRYEDKVWEFYGLAFAALAKVSNRSVTLERLLLDVEVEIAEKLNRASGVKPSILLTKNALENPADYLARRQNLTADLEKKAELYEQELETLDRIRYDDFALPDNREEAIKRLNGLLPEDLADRIIHFKVDDPFESAFALLYLLDTGSDVPWLYYGSISVAQTLVDQLPFDSDLYTNGVVKSLAGLNDTLYTHRYRGTRWPDPEGAEDSDDGEHGRNAENAEHAEHGKEADYGEYGEYAEYGEYGEDAFSKYSLKSYEREYGKNLSQILYANTGMVFPRVAPSVYNPKPFWDDLGELTPREKESYALALHSLQASFFRNTDIKQSTWFDEYFDVDEEDEAAYENRGAANLLGGVNLAGTLRAKDASGEFKGTDPAKGTAGAKTAAAAKGAATAKDTAGRSGRVPQEKVLNKAAGGAAGEAPADTSGDTSPIQPISPIQSELDQLSGENERLRNKNARLVDILNSLQKANKELEQNLSVLAAESDKQHVELSDLRERVYNLDNQGEREAPEDVTIQYPYTVKGKIVSFGGHISWIQEMKKLLPNVIFISPDTLPNMDIIRGADAVWIQTNCISHSNYYKILTSVKNLGKQVRFFVFSGHRKCAEQMVKSVEE